MDIDTESVIFTQTRPEIFIFLTVVGAEMVIRSYRCWKRHKASTQIYPAVTQTSSNAQNRSVTSLSNLVSLHDIGPLVILFSFLLVLFFLRSWLGPTRTIYYAGSVFMDFLLLALPGKILNNLWTFTIFSHFYNSNTILALSSIKNMKLYHYLLLFVMLFGL